MNNPILNRRNLPNNSNQYNIYRSQNLTSRIIQNQLNNYKNEYNKLLNNSIITSNQLLNNSFSHLQNDLNIRPIYPKQFPIIQSVNLPKIQLGRTLQIPSSYNNNCNNCNKCNNCNNCNSLNLENLLNIYNKIPLKEETEDKPKYLVLPPKVDSGPLNPPNIVIPYRKHSKIELMDDYDYIPPPIETPFPENDNFIERKKFPQKNNNLSSKKSIKKKRTKNKSFNNDNDDDRKWWKLATNFVDLFVFFKTAVKYIQFSRIRNKKIKDRNDNIGNEIITLKKWIISIEKPFFEEFKIFKDLSQVLNSNTKIKISKENKQIKGIIKKFQENLLSKTKKLKDEKIEKILYNFIKERAYFPHSFLTTNQVYRIDFHFYGGTRMINDYEASMILAYLLINGIVVQQILLNIGKNFNEYKGIKDISTIAKYVGSIIHYLTRETFKDKPKMHKNFWSVLNYYRNYNTINEELEACNDIYGRDMKYIEKDQFTKYLIPFEEVQEFWELNKEFVQNYKNSVYVWAVYLARWIKGKFYKYDLDLKHRKRIKKPKNKTMNKK